MTGYRIHSHLMEEEEAEEEIMVDDFSYRLSNIPATLFMHTGRRLKFNSQAEEGARHCKKPKLLAIA